LEEGQLLALSLPQNQGWSCSLLLLGFQPGSLSSLEALAPQWTIKDDPHPYQPSVDWTFQAHTWPCPRGIEVVSRSESPSAPHWSQRSL
jgi:hypothetical protein